MVTTTAAVTPGETVNQGSWPPRSARPGWPRSRPRPGGGRSTPPTPPTTGSSPRWSRSRAAPTRSSPPSASAATSTSPIVTRGGGTSIAGNALSTGLVLDLSRHLNRVLHIDPEQQTALVEPGTVLDDITAAAAPHGLRFGPDPSTHSRATIGGSIGNNACGSRALRYGRTADNVLALDVVTGTGTRFTAEREREATAGARRRRPGRPGRQLRPTCAAWSTATWPRSGPSSAGSPARCPATRSSTCCRRTASTSPSSCPAPRAPSR